MPIFPKIIMQRVFELWNKGNRICKYIYIYTHIKKNAKNKKAQTSQTKFK